MFDHLSFGTLELARATAFYDAALKPLGIARVWTSDESVGYGGVSGEDKLAIKLRAGAALPGAGYHLALTAASRTAVDGFFAAAVRSGGLDQGPPGLRLNDGPGYDAAFVADPDGNRLEAVCHEALEDQS